MPGRNVNTIEVRAFGGLAGIFDAKEWTVPLVLDLQEPITDTALAAKLEIPKREIEGGPPCEAQRARLTC
jgi:hypothetical protein